MIDEFKLRKEAERGAQAEVFLNSELVQEAFKTLEREYTDAMVKTHPHEVEARENYYRAINILADFGKHFKAALSNGKLARKQLNDLADKFRPRAA